MMSKSNPFGNFADFQKQLTQFRVPGIDPNQWIEIYERNLAAATQAGEAISTGVKACAEKQAAMLQASLEQAQAAYKNAPKTGEPSAAAAEQMERAKTAFEQAVQDMNEISQIMAKTNAEALEAINHRITESFSEIQKILSQSGK